MTGIFRTNNSYNPFLLFIYGLLLKLPMFWHPVTPLIEQHDGFLYQAFIRWLQSFTGPTSFVYAVIAYLLLYTQAIVFNKIVMEQRMFPRPNYFTAMSYLIITSFIPECNILSAPLIINTIMLWAWAKMGTLHHTSTPKTALFNVGLIIGCATFLYFPALWFVILVFFSLVLTRPFKLAEWLMPLLGIMTPYYFLLAWMAFEGEWEKHLFQNFQIRVPLFTHSNWWYAALAIIAITGATGFLLVLQNFRRQLIQARKNWNLLFLYLLICIGMSFINATHFFSYFLIITVPLSALVAAAFLYPAKKWVSLILHWLMIGFIIGTHYFVKGFYT